MENEAKQGKRRAARPGRVTLGFRVPPCEREVAERLAEALGIKLSDAARLIYRAGLAGLEALGEPQRTA